MDIEKDIERLRNSGISRTKAAEALGINKYKLDCMLEAMAVEWKPRIRGGIYEVDGEKKTLHEHAEQLGVPPSTLRQRLLSGKDPQAPAPNIPVSLEEAQAFTDLRKQGVAAWDAAKQVGRPYNTLKTAAKKMIPEYEAIAANAPRIRRSPEEIENAA